MKVQISPETILDIRFYHSLENNISVTRIIHGDELIGEGTAKCSKNDKFSRPLGRKVSLARALLSSPLTKEARKLVWKQYFQEHKKGRNKFLVYCKGNCVTE